jgi:hypothetical protein
MTLKNFSVYKLSHIFFSYPSSLKFKFHLGNWLSSRLSLNLGQALKIWICESLTKCSTICSFRRREAHYQGEDEEVSKFTSSAVGRSFGSNANILSNKRSASGSALGNFWENGMGFFFLMLLRYLRAFSLRTCSYNTNTSAYRATAWMKIRKTQIVNDKTISSVSRKAYHMKYTLAMASGEGVPKRSVIRSN